MPDDVKPDPDPLSDESIASIVAMTEKAEMLAAQMSCSVSKAMEMLLRAAKIAAADDAHLSVLDLMKAITTRVQ